MFKLSDSNTTVFGVMGANATNGGASGAERPAVTGNFTGDTLDTLASGGIALSWTVYQGAGGFAVAGARGVDAVRTPYETDYLWCWGRRVGRRQGRRGHGWRI